MGEPARVYDEDQDEKGFRPDLRALEGGGESTPRASGHLQSVGDRELDKLRESTGDDTLGKGFNANPRRTASDRIKGLGEAIKRRKLATAGGVGGIGVTGVILALLGISSGPMELANLQNILSLNGRHNEDQSALRVAGLFRFAKTGDIGETRVGKVGSVIFGKTIAQLEDAGIEFKRNKITGVPEEMTIDPSKRPELADIKDKTGGEARAALAEKFGLDEKRFSFKDGKFSYDARGIGLKATRGISSNALSALDNGKIIQGMKFRVMSKFFNLPSLFHPYERTKAKALNKIAITSSAKAKAAEEERLAKNVVADTPEVESAKSSIKAKLDPVRSAASKALLITATMCLAHNIADDIITVNRAEIVDKAAIQATDAQAAGSQSSSGQDIAPVQAGATFKTHTALDENGENIYDAKALQAIINPYTTTGRDMPAEYGQAFSGSSTAEIIKNTVGGGVVGDIACSRAGLVVQAVGGLALFISGFFDAGASWGAKAAFVGTEAAQMAATAGAMYFIEKKAVDLASDKALVPDVATGALGGNLLAYGAREAANMDARATGGVELSSHESAMVDQAQADASLKEFQSKNTFARLFDTSDYHSLASRVAMSIGPRPMFAIPKVLSTIINPLSSLSFAAAATPKVHAATDPYQWGFNRYGIPDSVIDNPDYADPYANANKVAEVLDGSDSDKYIDKAEKCFGVAISQDSDGKWAVIPDKEVNPQSADYTDAHCSDMSDTTWQRVLLFVMDSRTMDAAACYEGDEESCANLGIKTDQNICSTTDSSDGSLPDWVELPTVNAPIGGPVKGKISVAYANIRSHDTFAQNLRTIHDNNPDFIGLNEVYNESLPYMEQSAPGYGAYRDNSEDPDSANRGQETNNAIMWNKSRWDLLDSGRVKITNHDHVIFQGQNKDWNRYAVWGTFKRKSDGAITSFVATHMMTGPDIQKQWGTIDPPMTRTQQYGQSMENLKQLVGVLSQHGPVLVGGDMNVTANNNNSWAPAPQMKAIGYDSSSDGRVILSFNPRGTTVANNRVVRLDLHGDHNNGSIQTTINMNSVGPETVQNSSTVGASSNCGTNTGTSMIVASFNMRGASHTDSNEDHRAHKDWRERMDKSISVVESNKLDIIGFQEFEPKQYDLFKQKMGSTYELTEQGDHLQTPNSIAWNKSKYRLVNSYIQPNLQYFGGVELRAPYVKLEDIATQQQFYVLNTHDPANARGCNCAPERLHNANAHVDLIKQLKATGLPVIYTGDFNSGYEVGAPGKNGSTVDQKPENITYCVMTRGGTINDGYDKATNREVKCPNPLPRGSGGGIDHIYVTDEFTVSSFKWLAGGYTTNGSDHPTAVASISIPGAGDQTGSVRMSNDYDSPACERFRAGGAPGLACDGECVDFVKLRLKKNIDRNKFAHLGDGYSVAAGLGNEYGYKVNHTPAVNSVASWPAGGVDGNGDGDKVDPGEHANSGAGHTAMVSRVNKDGSIVVEETNADGTGHYGTRTIPAGVARLLTYAHTEVDF